MTFISWKQQIIKRVLQVLDLGLVPICLILTFSLIGFPRLRLNKKALAETEPLNHQPINPKSEDHSEFIALQQKLVDYGFQVKLEIPPYANHQGRKPFGLVRNHEKTVWINPVVFDLGNELPVLIHEAVHAAQICAGNGNFSPLNIDLEAPQIALPYFLRYHNLRRELEAEAYIVQTQPNSLDLAAELLDKHCSLENQP